jgi:hypothetical protein
VTISGNYPQPVQVNGYTCRNCTEVDLAKKHIDPAHPQSGPFDVNSANDPTRRNPAVKLGGVFASATPDAAVEAATQSYQPGRQLDVRV